MLSTETKAQVIAKFQRTGHDSGSPEVQIALLSASIEALTQHLKAHKKDFHSRRGLLKMVSRRRKLLDYLKRINFKQYAHVIAALGLRK